MASSSVQPFDFDQLHDWGPLLTTSMSGLLPPDIGTQIRKRRPEFIQDACKILLSKTDRRKVADHVTDWIKGQAVYGYHGTRLTESERLSVMRKGLVPLVAADRAHRLRRSLSAHPRWFEIEPQLDEAIELFGARARAGRREGQVHLTVSRAGLTNSFNYYLRQGAEFDWHVSHHLLGKDGQALVSADGASHLVKVRVPGESALRACNRYGIPRDELPNLIRPILEVWSYWLAYPEYDSATRKLDCGMVFRETVPAVDRGDDCSVVTSFLTLIPPYLEFIRNAG